MEEETNWYNQDAEELMKAMLKAQEAFDEYFDDLGIDGAYFGIEITGYVLGHDFQPLEKIDFEPDMDLIDSIRGDEDAEGSD